MVLHSGIIAFYLYKSQLIYLCHELLHAQFSTRSSRKPVYTLDYVYFLHISFNRCTPKLLFWKSCPYLFFLKILPCSADYESAAQNSVSQGLCPWHCCTNAVASSCCCLTNGKILCQYFGIVSLVISEMHF